ncbi:MAG: GtrA family protein [Bacteroidales bacterium]|nr:GtrA family protein [Bacteroidales bacterium]
MDIRSLLKRESVSQLLKYLIVGVICMLFDFSIFFLLRINLPNWFFDGKHSIEFVLFDSYFQWDIVSVISNTLSFSLASILNYFLASYLIFKFHVMQSRNREFAYYVIIAFVGLIISNISVSIFSTLGIYFELPHPLFLAKLASIAVTFIWNFGSRKYFLHSDRKPFRETLQELVRR